MKKFLHTYWIEITVILAALLWKLIWLSINSFSFNSDEAIVGLMAKHILAGEHPIFFYGQSYMGSLDAWLVAGGFLIFGVKVWVIRLVQVILYLATLFIVMRILQNGFADSRIKLFCGLLLAIPTVNVLLYTTISLGGYGEALFLGVLYIRLFQQIQRKLLLANEQNPLPVVLVILLGLTIGIGIWANALSLVFGIPVGIALFVFCIRRHQKQIWLTFCILIASILLGLFPIWVAAARSGFASIVNEFFGSAVAVEHVSWLTKILQHFVNLLLFGLPVTFGLRPPWGVNWLAVPIIPVAIAFWIFVFVFSQKALKLFTDQGYLLWILRGICLLLIGGFIFTSFGTDPSGRYFIPLAIPLSIIAGIVLVKQVKKQWQQWVILSLVLLFNVIGTIQCAIKNPPGITTQFYEPSVIDHQYDNELIDFLKENNEVRGYANYWVSYPLAFLSDEEIIFTPRLPYHLDLTYTTRDDRYASYDNAVEKSDRVALITTNNPNLDEALKGYMSSQGIKWKERSIGDYHVFYALSERLSYEELALLFKE